MTDFIPTPSEQQQQREGRDNYQNVNKLCIFFSRNGKETRAVNLRRILDLIGDKYLL